MKKKTTVQKKISFNKTTIAALNAQHQAMIAGGLLPITRQVACQETNYASCNTFRYTEDQCILC
ncbi:class I lanthipeptide [Chitinophaga flava]|uniref:Class I lanthipeptide n=1 Tax=Chitinophaga flava TaxID=2259036 RepID=A0A365XUX7_9BACT|nr:class I lanthipeptide [Chitinophaga flava]RBL90149.1 hypothetical protein DF182_27160 [Chitinophaga flava]